MTAKEEEFTEASTADILQTTQVKDHAFGSFRLDCFSDNLTDVLMMRGIKPALQDDDKESSCFFKMDIHGRFYYEAVLWTVRQGKRSLKKPMSSPPRLPAPRSIGQRFALAIGAGAGVILIALATANYLSSREILLQQTSSEALKEVHDQIHSIDELVDRMAMLPMVIGANEIASQDKGGVTVTWLASLLKQCPIKAVYGLYMILDEQDWRQGDSFRWVNRKSYPGAATLHYDFHDESHDWYTGAKKKRGIYVTQPYFAEGGSEIEMISITQAVFNQSGTFVGVAGVDVSLDEIRKIVTEMHIRELQGRVTRHHGLLASLTQSLQSIPYDLHESAYLISNKGKAIISPETRQQHPNITDEKLQRIKSAILSSESGWLRLEDGSGKVLYWATGGRTGWKLVLEVPYSLIVAPAWSLAIESILLGGIGLLLLLGVVLIAARRISGPIRELQMVTARFEKGSYGENEEILERIGKREDELGKFAQSFSSMVHEIRLREERLAEWNANLEATVEERTADLAKAMQAIEKTNAAMSLELAEAAAYARAVLPEKITGWVTTDWVFETSSQLGGDSFGYHWIDEDHLAIYLLDVCGHGVGAALLSVSVVNLLRTTSLTAADFLDPSAVLSSLNQTFPMERHKDMYFTAWYGVYTHSTRKLSFACGGHPPAVLISPEGFMTSLSAKGVIVGAFAATSYETVTVGVPEGSRLYLFSDGVYEIDRPDGTMMGYDEFVEILRHAQSASRLSSIVSEIKRQQESDFFVDDFSLVEFLFYSSHPSS